MKLYKVPEVVGKGRLRGKAQGAINNCTECTGRKLTVQTPSAVVALGIAPKGRSAGMLRVALQDAQISPVSWVPPATGTLCRDHMFREVEAAWTQFVLLVGQQALNNWRPDLRLKDTHGQMFMWLDRYLVMPVYAPNPRDADALLTLSRDVAKFGEVVRRNNRPEPSYKCIKCDLECTDLDMDYVGYCKRHWDGDKPAAKARTDWVHRGEQLRMEMA